MRWGITKRGKFRGACEPSCRVLDQGADLRYAAYLRSVLPVLAQLRSGRCARASEADNACPAARRTRACRHREAVPPARLRALFRRQKLRALMVERGYLVAVDGEEMRERAAALRHGREGDKARYAVYVVKAVVCCPAREASLAWLTREGNCEA